MPANEQERDQPGEHRAHQQRQADEDGDRQDVDRRHAMNRNAAPNRIAGSLTALALADGDRLGDVELGAGIGLAVLDELVDDLADRPLARRAAAGSAGLSIRRVSRVLRLSPSSLVAGRGRT